MAKPKQGKEFEELVTWINRCLHEKAKITPNDKIRDVHSKRFRQVDISIRLEDGPTSFFGIVEVRDRTRPVGEDYIEQVSAKRQSVGADAAFIVSSSGFYEAAIQKAQALNIRIFSHKEAVSSDWTLCLQLTEITHYLKRWDNIRVTFLDPVTDTIIDLPPEVREVVRSNPNTPVLLNQNGEPKCSILKLFACAVNARIDHFYGGATFVDPKQRRRSFVNVQAATAEETLYFRDLAGKLRKLEKFHLEADFWVELKRTPVRVSKYFDAGTGKALAEVASASVQAWGEDHRLDLIAKFSSGGDEAGKKISLRMQKQNKPNESK